MPEVIIRPDLGKKPYRLRCRFLIEAFPRKEWLDKAKVAAAERFVEDMHKQGWEYVEREGFRMTGPYPMTQTVVVPKRREQSRWHIPSREMLPAVEAGYRLGRMRSQEEGYAYNVPLIGETERWEYEIAGVFYRNAILTEYPDRHEEAEVLKQR